MEKCGIGKWREKPDSYRNLSIENARKHAQTNNFGASDSAHYEPESETETREKRKEKPKLHKACGLAEQGYYESIYHKDKPAFLVANDGAFRICEEVTVENETFLPKEYPHEFPYEPYGHYDGALPSREELFWKIREEFDLFLDLEPIWKDYLAACVLLSYQQEKTCWHPR